ncbi:MAG TPA: preprotein translocase subunit SecY [Firmicutes bacterium]|jgi:preprotein translocase subunit SecY|nr:preprotein translocase subunit SecY [Bacillota bacterium]
MFATFKQIFKKTNKDLKSRVLYTLGALFIFALGNAITVPGMSAITENLGFLELLNAMSGGGLKQFSIFALGVMPYITASILLQVLQMDLMGITYFQELKEMGEEGRRKINQINRYLGIGFALIEGYIYSIMFMGKTATPLEYVEISLILTAGTAFLLYLGDQITNKGLGNGISLIIMAGIVNTMPRMMIEAFNALAINGSNTFLGILSFVIFILLYIGIIVGVIYVQEAERRIPIQYSNRSTGTYKANTSFLPLRINSAGVMPVIFASAVLAIPTTLTYIIKNESFKLFVDKYLSTQTPVGFIVYILLIIAFTYGYTYLAAVNPEDISKNLNKQNGYIPGIRPGTETTKYVSKVLSRITFMGAIFIAIIAAIPIIFSWISDMPSIVTLGGTSILIVVGVLLETYKQLESSVASRAYRR